MLPLAEARKNLRGDEIRFFVLIISLIHGDFVALIVVRPELLSLSSLVVGDHRVGCLQDVLGGAVVLLQTNYPGALILLFKAQNVLNGSAADAIDGLIVVTHHTDILIPPGQQCGQKILQIVGVLILVNEHIAELPLIVVPHILILLEQPHG